MRNLAIVVCVVVSFPSVAYAGSTVEVLERALADLSQALHGLEGVAAEVRATSGAAKEEALVKGREELSKLDPVFQNAQEEVERLEQEEATEKRRERIEQANDLLEAYKELEREHDRLADEFCGPRDFYKYNGGSDCPDDTSGAPKYRSAE
jgi:DNA repair exonuclease SbcCD ATPase subunit